MGLLVFVCMHFELVNFVPSSIPEPQLFPPDDSPLVDFAEVKMVQPALVSGVLVPVGMGVTDWSGFGQCLCLEWSPGNKHSKIAAGFSSGTSTQLLSTQDIEFQEFHRLKF